jgi:hypothetical protein
MTEQTAPRSITPDRDRAVLALVARYEALAQRVTTLEHKAAPEPEPADASHLIHHVIRVSGEERTVVAAFSEEVDALVWQDHLSHEAATQEEPDTYTVEGVHVPTEEELAPFIEQAKAALRGTDQ